MWLVATQDFTFGDQTYLTGERFQLCLRDAFTLSKRRVVKAITPERTQVKRQRRRRPRKATEAASSV